MPDADTGTLTPQHRRGRRSESSPRTAESYFRSVHEKRTTRITLRLIVRSFAVLQLSNNDSLTVLTRLFRGHPRLVSCRVARLELCSAGEFPTERKDLVTVPATLKTDDNQVTQDAVMLTKQTRIFQRSKSRQKESLVFDQNSGGM
jgi:hypothetical protein